MPRDDGLTTTRRHPPERTESHPMADCYCYTCDRGFHSLGIARHRAMHRDHDEDCKIEYEDGAIYKHNFAARAGGSDPVQSKEG